MPRIHLRAFTVDDVPLLVDLDSDPRVMTYINGGTPTPEIDIRENFLPRVFRYHEEADGLGFWAAEHTPDQAFMGWFHLYANAEDSATLEIGYRLKHAFWDQGIAIAMTGNQGSVGVMKKLGMTFEERYTHPKGMDVVRYGIDRATFVKSNGYNS